MRRVIFHVGLHKTGTTSIQTFLSRTRRGLEARGVGFYNGAYRGGNHVEVTCAAMRIERDSPFKNLKRLIVDEAFRHHVGGRVSEFISGSDCQRVLFSAESLSLLRHPDEMERLRRMVPAGKIEILIYLREAGAYLASYARQIRNNLPDVIDKDSYAYTAPDSWLLDLEARVDGFRAAFGRDNVTVIDYDRAIAAEGNVVPSFLRAIGIETSFRQDLWRGLFLNRSKPETPQQ